MVVIYVEEGAPKDLSRDSIREAIRGYFAYRSELQRADLKNFIKRAQVYLVIGLIILAAGLGVAQSLKIPSPPGALGILREGIVLFGWDSIWKPIELALFDWYSLFEKLLRTEIDIHFT